MDIKAQKLWMRQWRAADVALGEQHRLELHAMTAEQALAASEALLSMAAHVSLHPSRLTSSGMVRQQALLHRRVPK